MKILKVLLIYSVCLSVICISVLYLVAPQEPPHFSQSVLCHQYAQTDKLTYIYYLYEGQPSFAFANFVAAKLANHSNLNKR